MSKVALLQKGFLFQNFTPHELQLITETVTERWASVGSIIFGENAPADSLFVIQQGTVEIVKEGGENKEVVVARLSEGAHFGEMAFVDRAPRAAAARACENTKLIELPYAALERIVATQPIIGLKLYHSIAKTLCARIRQTTNDLSHLYVP